MIDEGLAEYGLEMADKADYAEVRMESVKGNSITMSNGVIEGSELSEEIGLSVRVLVNGAMGFHSTNMTGREAIKEAVDKAIKIASLQERKEKIGLSDEKAWNDRWEINEKKSSPGLDEIIDYLQSLDSIAKDDTLSRVFFYDGETAEKYYVNTDGTKIYSKTPLLSLYYLITVGEGGKTEQMNREFGNAGGWEFVEKWKAGEALVRDISVMKKLISEGKKPPEGRLDIVVGPYITGLIAHESCGHPFEADRILGREAAQAGKSFIGAGMLGERMGSECVSVVDDPMLPNSYGHYRYDDEGVRARKRYLIKDGMINEFLHNRETAFSLGKNSNAAARASAYDREPIVRMANTYIQPGDFSMEELIGGVKKGIYMATFMEWNIDDRRYNQKYVGEEAYYIDRGEISHMVRHPALEITTPSFYQSVDAVGRKLEFYPATCGKGEPMQGVP
ncbi:MAG: TldD/PmbA family protein, partial [Thermodesulfobacteriota bacterium]|nr:TldD/PmbA family protein [Thermodesulfobacteriota bacterium]